MAKKVELYLVPDTKNQDEWLDKALKVLGLEGMRKSYKRISDEQYKKKGTYRDFLKELCEVDCDFRNENLKNRRLRNAKFPFIKTIEDYDFSFPTEIDEQQINEIASLRFIDKKTNVILLGAQGLGKTHLAVGFGIKAIDRGKDVIFVRINELNDLVSMCPDAESLHKMLGNLKRPQLLILDDWDVYKVSERTSIFLTKLIEERYQKGSIIITSTGTFSDWQVIFGNQRIAAKMIDRLTHDAEIVTIRAKDSYRNKNRLKLAQIIPSEQIANYESGLEGRS